MTSPNTLIAARLIGADSALAFKAPVAAATTANITLAGFQTIDGVTYAAPPFPNSPGVNNRCLVKSQTDQTTNGLYDVQSGAWTRCKDFDDPTKFLQGTVIVVSGGTANVGVWQCTSQPSSSLPIGSFAITFQIYSGGLLPVPISIASGGTGQGTQAAGFDALSPTTTRGDLIARGAASNQRLALGTSGYQLQSNGIDPVWAGFLQSGTGAVTRTWQNKARDFINVLDFGAVGDGVTDDTTAIKNAINSLPAQGGTIIFPALTYKISSTLTIGNGSSSAVSTKQGVLLLGLGVPVPNNFSGFTGSLGPKLVWAGGNNTDMLKIAGPLVGWGVQNLAFDGGSTSGLVGLHVTSACFGEARNLVFYNVWRSIASDCVSAFPPGTSFAGSMHNNYDNIFVTLPNISGPVIGILVTGDGLASPNSDTFSCSFNNVLFFPSAFPLANVTFGLYLQTCDTNNFRNIAVWSGSNATLTPITFDYGVASAFPTANVIYGIDYDAGTIGFSGTPAAGISPNYIIGLQESNGSVQPSGVPNLNFTSSIPSLGTIRLVAQTVAISATTLFHLANLPNAFWRISYYLEVVATGTGGTIQLQLVWKDTINPTETFNSATVPVSPFTGFTSGTVVIRTEGTPDPTYAVLFNAVTGSPQFRLFMKVEKLD